MLHIVVLRYKPRAEPFPSERKRRSSLRPVISDAMLRLVLSVETSIPVAMKSACPVSEVYNWIDMSPFASTEHWHRAGKNEDSMIWQSSSEEIMAQSF